MSTIPPNIVGPIAQSVQQQRSTARALEAERDQQANAAEVGNRSSQRSAEAIDEADNDTQVHTDAEGLGGQGRHHADEHPEHHTHDPPSPEAGIQQDADGHLHLDVEA